MSLRLWTSILLSASIFILGAPLTPPFGERPFAPAWADDDDDDGGSRGRRAARDDDDDDDDDGGSRGVGGRRSTPPPRPAPPLAAPREIVVLSLTEADLAVLSAQGFEVIEEIVVAGLPEPTRRLRIPPGLSPEDARSAARGLPSGADADFNHYYRAEQHSAAGCVGPECPARIMVGWPEFPERETACGRSVAIGMIDTGINDAHETFVGSRMDVIRVAPEGLEASRAVHGTAVAALLVGSPSTRSPGLTPGSRLVAIDAFHRAGADERADLFTLVQGLGRLAAEGVRVINLSLAGPPNAVLAEMMQRLVTVEDIVVVAAVGNLGPNAEPAYPAAYPPVIAVTAVDRGGAVYRRAGRGDHVDLAAPGVKVWTAASISGARWKTGTSFAAPFVTAAAAYLREARPELSASEVQLELRRRANDIGAPGRDPVFGAGLVDVSRLCRP